MDDDQAGTSACTNAASGEDEPGSNLQSISIDKEMIHKHLKASHVKVHVDNLVKPYKDLQVRELDERHVKAMAESFMLSYNNFTTFVGLVDDGCSIENLTVPGQCKVQVLGGNHSREAIQAIRKRDEFKDAEEFQFVYMDIYSNLTKEQAWYLGYSHNEIHSNSKEMSFMEKVTFFRKALESCQSRCEGANQKKISQQWRSDLAAVLNKTKNDLKNCCKIHLHLAATCKKEWKLLEQIFRAFGNKKLKGQKECDTLTQYTFKNFCKMKAEKTRMAALSKLADTSASLEEFRQLCGREDLSSTSPEQRIKIAAEQKSNRKRKSPSNSEGELEGSYMEKKLDETMKLLEKEKSKRIKLEKEMKKAEEEIKMSRENEKLLIMRHREEVEKYRSVIEKNKKVLQNAKMREEDLSKALQAEKERTLLAEEAAARARSKLNDIKAKQNSQFDKSENIRITEHEKMSCLKTNLSKEEKEKEQNVKTDQRNKNGSTESDVTMNIAIVEYTQGHVYFGIIEGEEITYCQKPIGQIKEEKFIHCPSKSSFIVNNRDRQTFNSSYIIVQMTGKMQGKNIDIHSLTLSSEAQALAIRKYVQSGKNE